MAARLAALLALALVLAPPASGAGTAPRAPGEDPALRPPTGVGAHTMLYATTPLPAKDVLVASAVQFGADAIRVELLIPAIAGADGSRDWTPLADLRTLRRRYGVRVVAVLWGVPAGQERCPASYTSEHRYRCPPADVEAWGRLVGEIAARSRGAVDAFEIHNEPDVRVYFPGTPDEYAHMLAVASRAIRAQRPDAPVVLGGLTTQNAAWTRRVLDHPRWPGRAAIDIANLHVRDRVDRLAARVREERARLAAAAFDGPLWVTEHGYPADPVHQFDPAFADGAPGQARYLARSVPALRAAGVERVFVTLRDNLAGTKYASEGILGGSVLDPLPADPVPVPRPAAAAVAAVAFGSRRPLALALASLERTRW